MKAIVAINNHGYIGDNGMLMWRCKEDFKHFKEKTMGGLLIVGRVTYEECLGGKSLPGRAMVIVGKEYHELGQAVRMCHEIAYVDQKIVRSDGKGRDIWVIGGKTIYDQLLPLCDEVHISHINNDDVGDVKFELPLNYRGKVFNYNFEEDE